ncbi:putative gustatory receptor clone PTE01 [Artibeus jamaicensis]|uniref:putative gustatory receptor clone PTE01 n=1 Tax=Artibeus jamaicensis TaxID=9417 RepID=UPI00235AA317|nr:putative gustatory receptor clone PTE01 [Artibeus jamaicensis]
MHQKVPAGVCLPASPEARPQFFIVHKAGEGQPICLYSLVMVQQRCSLAQCAQNLTRVSEFFLMSLSDDLELQPLLFGLFLSMYLVTVLGNLLIILAISSDSHLHTPMYFFLSNLSLADICFISTTVPKMIVDIHAHRRVIPYGNCLTQMSFLILFGCMDGMLLTVMAYDRFVAICHPLHYPVIMNPCLCCFLVLVSFLISLLDSQLHNLIVLQLTCFKDVKISNFFCDPSQLLHLACSDTFTNNLVMYFVGTISGGVPLSGIFFSYYKIVSSILRVPSVGGKYKAFSTCGSHLSVVCLFYGTAFGVYLGSTLLPSPREAMAASVMYSVVTPMLNPFIYSLRNRDIKSALWRLHSRTVSS